MIICILDRIIGAYVQLLAEDTTFIPILACKKTLDTPSMLKVSSVTLPVSRPKIRETFDTSPRRHNRLAVLVIA